VSLPEPEGFDLATCQRPFVSATKLAGYLDCDRRTIVRMIHAGSFGGGCLATLRSSLLTHAENH
jgi:hypothetical protein